MGWKLNAGLGAGFIAGAIILLTVFQKEIRNATYTAGQTLGQAVTSPIEGFAEPFANLAQRLKQLFPDSIGGTPSSTPPLAIAPPSAYAPPYTGPPAGATPPKQDNNNGGNSGSSSGGSPPLFPGYTGQPDGGLFSPAAPPKATTPATPPRPKTPATPKPATTTPTPPTTKAVGTITINRETATDYTKFVNTIMATLGNYGTSVVNLANQAWKQIQNGNQYIVIPGLPVISSPVIPAFAEKQKTTKADISSNDKKTLSMGNAAAKNIVTTPLTVTPGSVWNVSKIKIPQSAPSVSAQSALLKAGLGNLVIGKNSA